jgi:hypothetical protein
MSALQLLLLLPLLCRALHMPAAPHVTSSTLYFVLLLLLLQSLLGVIDIIRGDMYTHPHVRYYMREVRLVAYNQVRCGAAQLAAELALLSLI